MSPVEFPLMERTFQWLKKSHSLFVIDFQKFVRYIRPTALATWDEPTTGRPLTDHHHALSFLSRSTTTYTSPPSHNCSTNTHPPSIRQHLRPSTSPLNTPHNIVLRRSLHQRTQNRSFLKRTTHFTKPDEVWWCGTAKKQKTKQKHHKRKSRVVTHR